MESLIRAHKNTTKTKQVKRNIKKTTPTIVLTGTAVVVDADKESKESEVVISGDDCGDFNSDDEDGNSVTTLADKDGNSANSVALADKWQVLLSRSQLQQSTVISSGVQQVTHLDEMGSQAIPDRQEEQL